MNTYIVMLRGINVSGQKKIKMADLKAHLEDIGFTNVQTYIQSGNVVFSHEKLPQKTIEKLIGEKILAEYGWDVPVMAKNPDEFEYLLMNNPFLKDKDTERLYITFLSDEPNSERQEYLKSFDYSPEEYILDGKFIYFYAPNGYGKATMNNNFFENKLKVSATTRNWKTVNVLFELATK